MSDKLPSYPRPDVNALPHEEPQHLRPLVPLQQYPPAAVPPSTSIPAVKHDAIPGYTRTSHVIPAAFPRSLPTDSPLRKAMISGQKVDAKMLAQSLINTKLAFESPESQKVFKGMSRTAMWNCVDRYVRVSPASKGNPNKTPSITLFVTHATGFPRQIWEPTLAHLASLATSGSGIQINEMWSFEAVQHGDSGLINEGKHSDTFDWQDHARDIINFLTYYLPDSPHAHDLPTVLERVPRPGQIPYRQVVGIGHSFGAATIALAGIVHPKLFQSLVLVEALLIPSSFKRGPILDRLIRMALSKPSQWSSRQSAKETFRKYPPTSAWDPAVVDVFVEHGLVQGPANPAPSSQSYIDVPVQLKTQQFDEAVMYCEWIVPYEVWTELENLDPRVALHWIMSGDTNIITGGDAMTQGTVWRRPTNASNVRLPGVGHLIVHESPKSLAAEIFRFLRTSTEKVDAKL